MAAGCTLQQPKITRLRKIYLVTILNNVFVIVQVGMRRFARDERCIGKEHTQRLRHPLVRKYESTMRPLQSRHRLRCRFGNYQ